MNICYTIIVCVSVVSQYFAKQSDAAMQPDYAAQIRQTEAFMTQLADARVLSGALLVSKAGKIVFSKGYGWSAEVSITRCASVQTQFLS
jgi:CubicO group peptidase (beta-lactamase class C family)